ncbi:MAG TPA: hypothetical protein VI258_04970, partial [Rhodanobacteraceae bacterium]
IAHRIGAEKREAALDDETVPEFFDTQGGFGLALLPEDVDHLAESARAARPHLRDLGENAADGFVKTRGVRRAVDHERVERVARIDERQLSAANGTIAIDAPRLQAGAEAFPMLRGGDHDHRVARVQAAGDELANNRKKIFFALVELNRVRRQRDGR